MNHTIYPTTSWTDQILEQGEKAGGSLSNYIHALVMSRFSGQSDDLVGSGALPAAGHVEPQPMPGTARRLEVRRYREKVSDFRLYLVRSSTGDRVSVNQQKSAAQLQIVGVPEKSTGHTVDNLLGLQ